MKRRTKQGADDPMGGFLSMLGQMERDGILCAEDREAEVLSLKDKSRTERRQSLGRFLKKVLKKYTADCERRGQPVPTEVAEAFDAAAKHFEGGR